MDLVTAGTLIKILNPEIIWISVENEDFLCIFKMALKIFLFVIFRMTIDDCKER